MRGFVFGTLMLTCMSGVPCYAEPDLASCPSKKDDKERLACFDAAWRGVPAPAAQAATQETEKSTSTKEVLKPGDEAKVVDASDMYVAPNKYVGRRVELRKVRCLHADKDEYRCIGASTMPVVIFSAKIVPDAERTMLEDQCGEIKKLAGGKCSRTIRFVPDASDVDTASFGINRTIVRAPEIEIVAQAPATRRR